MEPLTCGPVSDHHVHPDYSFDGKGSIDEYCRAAVRIGLREICFTPHYDANPARLDQEGFMNVDGEQVPLSAGPVGRYLEDIRRAYVEFGPGGLMVRGGLEFGYFPGCEETLAEAQRYFRVDYRLGAVHSVDDIHMCSRVEAPKLFQKVTLEQLADRYFDLMDRAAASGLFDCLAHLDIYRRYGLDFYGDEVRTIHRGRIEKLFATMKAHDVGYEINTSAIRHGQHEYYPSMEIVNDARKAGVRLVALGSDAHRVDQLALDFDAASTVAYDLFPYVDE